MKLLSLTSRSFFSLVRSPDLIAAWLWKQHGNDALLMAMRKKDLAVFRQLIEVQHADVNSLARRGVLHEACREGKLEFVTFLLSVPGIEVNLVDRWDRTALHYACSNGHQAVVHNLLQHPAVDVSIKSGGGDTALYLACVYNEPKIVVELLAHPGIDVNQTSGHHSSTGLHMACACGCALVVRELLKHPDIRVNQKQVRSEGRNGVLCSVASST